MASLSELKNIKFAELMNRDLENNWHLEFVHMTPREDYVSLMDMSNGNHITIARLFSEWDAMTLYKMIKLWPLMVKEIEAWRNVYDKSDRKTESEMMALFDKVMEARISLEEA